MEKGRKANFLRKVVFFLGNSSMDFQEEEKCEWRRSGGEGEKLNFLVL